MADPYQILGVSQDATEDEIKRAYKKLSRKYHPDANLDNPKAAEEKFKQIQQAYQQAMREKTQGPEQGAYGQGSPYGNQQGNPYGGAQGGYTGNPFEDMFGGFGGAYGGYNQHNTQTGYEKDSHLRAAGNYIRNGYYQEAKNVLDGMEAVKRNARWYYYSACANVGLGNNVTALEHARQAASMEPGNSEYQLLVNQLEGNGQWYQQKQQRYGNPYAAGGDWCMRICMLNLMCNLCCGGGGFCCGGPYGS